MKKVYSLVALSSVALLVNGQEVAKKKVTKQPNVVFILADDLGWGDLSVNGQKKFNTPNIDAIAKNGINFTNFYSNQTVSAPSRCSILTGKHQGKAYVRANQEINPEGQLPMPQTETTFAKILQKNGYATACIGKWGLGYPGSEGDPTKHGFDLFYGTNCQRQAHSYYPKYVWKNDKKIDLPNNHLKDGDSYAPDLYEKEALKFIDANKEKPFFLFYTTPIPHAALQVTEPYLEKYRGKFNEPKNPARYGPGVETKEPRAAFAGMVSHLDDEIGKMVELLKKNGQYENTIFIFSSDNGASSEGGHNPDYFESRPPKSTGLKTQLSEGGIRVPFFISWANGIKSGENSDRMYAFEDLFPTILEAAKVKVEPKISKEITGKSFLPFLLGKKDTQAPTTRYWEFPQFDGQVAVRFKNYKMIAKNMKATIQPQFALFDLEKDPQEKNNIIAENPEIVKQMRKIIVENHTTSPVNAPTYQFPQLDIYCQ